MAYTVTASTPANLLAAQLNPGLTFGGKALNNAFNLPGVAATLLHAGSEAGQVNLMGYTSGTLVAGTHPVDLSTLPDPVGTAKNFARVKGILVLNFATADAAILKVGGAGSTPWAAPFNGVGTSVLVVPPGWIDSDNSVTTYPGMFLLVGGNATALATSGTSKVIQLDSGAATIPWGIFVIGCDT